MKDVKWILFGFLLLFSSARGQQLKSVVYDFDGLNIGQTDLPEGDFKSGDLNYTVVANPLGEGEMLGDRVLKVDLNWNTGEGSFGRGISRFIEFNPETDRINFYVYNPSSNGAAPVQLFFTEDDDKNDLFDYNLDDKWISNVVINPGDSWQLISIPLSSFTDENIGGNGIFDAAFTNAGGMTFSVGFTFTKGTTTLNVQTLYLDMICFSEGAMPTGENILDLPKARASDYCLLGAYTFSSETQPELVPGEIESLFPGGGKKLRYVNWFLPFAKDASLSAHEYPGKEVTILQSKGYVPIITWEPLYASKARLDPVQPRLNNVLNGEFDGYIDNFGDTLKLFNDTVIVRLMHEFEGDWYPWSLTQNGQDPNIYISAFRYIVDRIRARGASKVKWMWCVNADPKPYKAYNWIYNAYPGDSYVDIVATDIYNHPNLGVPDWKSFKYTGIESYYYLNKYWPHKPLFICEIASRERYSSEPPGSQTKAGWWKQTIRDFCAHFNNARALVFFSSVKEHDWRINSSPQSLAEIEADIWNNSYFLTNPVGINDLTDNTNKEVSLYPNPFSDQFYIELKSAAKAQKVTVRDIYGKIVYSREMNHSGVITLPDIAQGLYFTEVTDGNARHSFRLVKTRNK